MDKKPFELTTISVKNLAQLAVTDTCERCFWIKARMGFKAPWSFFPGVFSSIDAYSKKVTTAWLQLHPGTLPPWLAPIQGVSQLPCPHWSKFAFKDPVTGITLRGTPDERMLCADGTVAIVDYKTSRYVAGKVDGFAAVYRAQLGGYRWLTLKLEQRVTSFTGLLYYSPPENTDDVGQNEITDAGFNMQFRGTLVPVETTLEEVESLLVRARAICSSPVAPLSYPGCKDCDLVQQMKELTADAEQ